MIDSLVIIVNQNYMIVFREITVQEPTAIICDRCGRRTENESNLFEFGEYLSIEHECGYGSVIGDGTLLELDLCQYCVKELLLPFARLTE
jgi:hypothetical protein